MTLNETKRHDAFVQKKRKWKKLYVDINERDKCEKKMHTEADVKLFSPKSRTKMFHHLNRTDKLLFIYSGYIQIIPNEFSSLTVFSLVTGTFVHSNASADRNKKDALFRKRKKSQMNAKSDK